MLDLHATLFSKTSWNFYVTQLLYISFPILQTFCCCFINGFIPFDILLAQLLKYLSSLQNKWWHQPKWIKDTAQNVPGFSFKFTLKMIMLFSTSQSKPKAASVGRVWFVNCCSSTPFLLSYTGIVSKTALLFERNLVKLKPPDLQTSFIFSISMMACSLLLTDFSKSST